MITQGSPQLFTGLGATRLFSGSSSAWVASTAYPRVNGHYYHDTTNNYWRSSPKGNVDRGSNWTLFKSEVKEIGPKVSTRLFRSSVWNGYKGHVSVNNAPGGVLSASISPSDFQTLVEGAASESTLMSYGSTAIAKVIPTNPISDLPTAIAELYNDGLPGFPGFDIIKHRRMTSDQLAGNYLNYSFAIKPLLADMRAFAAASERAEKLIDEYAARAGRKIRRRYNFSPEITGRSTSLSNPATGGKTYLAGVGTQTGIRDFLNPSYGGYGGDRTDTSTNYLRRWYSGCFTYYLPNAGHSFSSRLAREEAEMRHLYGGISIDTAWNLIPFSWAADWITNAGDVIHNVAAFSRDGLVMPWGYIMEEIDSIVTRKVVGARLATQGLSLSGGYSQIPSVITTTLAATSKRRRKANPYGFSLIPPGFTARQVAIMSALAIKFANS